MNKPWKGHEPGADRASHRTENHMGQPRGENIRRSGRIKIYMSIFDVIHQLFEARGEVYSLPVSKQWSKANIIYRKNNRFLLS